MIVRIVTLILCLSGWVEAFAQCSFDFTTTQDPCSPRTIHFSATATAVQSFTWDFGNGSNNSSTLTPSATYSSFDTNPVSLTITFTNGCTFTKTKQVAVLAQQDNNLISTSNSSICEGESLVLQSSAASSGFCWHTAAGSVSTTSQNITVTPASSTVYYYTAQASGGEAVVNGDFSSGNTGFTSSYTNCNTYQCISEGNYGIGPDAQFFHFDFRGTDHTTGTGNLMVANGMLTPNMDLWCQTVTVTPNSTYNFSMWLCTVAGEYAPAQLQVKINGVNVGTVATAPSTIYTWVQHTATWNSGSATTADLCIVTVSDWFGGNDFGIDDISLSTPSTAMLIDSVSITVTPAETVDVLPQQPVCNDVPVQLHAVTGAATVSWSPPQYLDNPASPNPQVTGLMASTMFYVQTGAAGCMDIDSVYVEILPSPTVSIDPVGGICAGQSVTLQGQVVGASNYDWIPAPGLSNPSQLSTVASPSTSTTYTLIAANGSCLDSAEVSVTVSSPQVDLRKSNDITCAAKSTVLTAAGASSYDWTATGGVPLGPGSIRVSPSQTTTYYVQGTDANGCTAGDSVQVVVYQTAGSSVFVPTAFTPGADNLSDIFKPVFTAPLRNYEFRIFNRWGQVVFVTSDPDAGWDGTFRHALPLPDVYVYWLRVETDCGNEFIKGSVVVIK